MASVAGRVNEVFEPLVRVRLGDNVNPECLVDTGFSGALMLPMSVIKALGLPILADEARLDLAGGETTMAALAFAEIEWLEKTVPVLIIIKDEYLLGSQLLEDTELVINYRIRTVSISN